MMKSLPIGYQVVAGLAIVFGSTLIGALVMQPQDVLGPLVALLALIYLPLQIYAGCRCRGVWRIAALVPFVLMFPVLALVTVLPFMDREPGGQLGPLGVVVIWVMFGALAMSVGAAYLLILMVIWCLARHRKRAQRIVSYKERFASLPTKALTTTLESGALDAEARDALDQILRDRLQPPAQIDTRFQAEQLGASERPRD